VAVGGVDYAEPLGGWTYIYTGDAGAPGADFTALDGTWSHDNGSDEWDETQIGAGRPGGVNILSDAGVTFVRLQDAGDPRDHAQDDPGSNRKIFFGHQLIDEIDQSVADEILSVHGITISFRARLSTTPPLDNLHPDGGGANDPWPAGGDGYLCHDGGKDCFGVHQEVGGDQTIGFALSLASDDDELSVNGLTMNKLNGTSPTGDVDLQGDEPGTVNILEIADLTVWHEFWITIEPDTSGGGTHKAKVYMDGSSTPTEFHLTAGTGGDFDESYISLGVGATPQSGAIDVDFFTYKEGIVTPAPADPEKARAVAPAPGTTVDLPEASPLGWIPGASAVQHDVYFGTDFDDVNDADTTDTTGIYRGRQNFVIYTPPEALELGQSYYWRIDEVKADDTIYKGDVWSYTIIGYILVDDFEDYNDYEPHRIFDVWIDGWGVTANGSTAGYPDPPFAETNIVHGGGQSTPLFYKNDAFAKYSEASITLTSPRDWTAQGVKALSLWFQGHPEYMGGFVEGPTGTYTMTAGGEDIEGNSDQFHFAFKELSGAGAIIAKVESVSNTDPWAKAGVMIRDTLESDSRHAMMAITPGNGAWFGRRTETGDSSGSDNEAGITAPQWVKIERTIGGLVRAFYSADGNTWTQLGAPEPVTMDTPVYIGLALTSHNSGVACEAKFSNVSFPNTTVGPQWTSQDIGMLSNEAEPMYVTAEDGIGTTATVYHDDPNASLIDTWTEWNIDLKDFSDQGANLNDIVKLSIGFGDKDDPQPGAGLVFFDDIRLYPPRYVPDRITPLTADFTDDGVVDIRDLEIMSNDWLQGDYTIYATTPNPAIVLWAFDNNANDSAGSNNGIPHGNPSYVVGKLDQAVSLDGDDYMDCGNPAELNFATGDWSICAWINTTQSDDTFTIFANGGDESGGIRYTLAVGETGGAGTIVLTTDDDDAKRQAVSSAGAVNDGQWHHAVGLRAGNTTQVYVDGMPDGTATLPAGYDLSGTSQHNAYVGAITDHRDATGNTLDKLFVGTLDDVRIYNYALSPAEIMSVMGQSELYVPLTSPANIYDEEPINSKKVNLKDFAILADEWLEQPVWPKW